MTGINERITRLEERVFAGQAAKLEELTDDIESLTKKLNYLIVVLAGNFGIAFVKLMPMVGHLFQ